MKTIITSNRDAQRAGAHECPRNGWATDTPNLRLVITKTGKRVWRLTIRRNGENTTKDLGDQTSTNYDSAREMARKFYEQLNVGHSPKSLTKSGKVVCPSLADLLPNFLETIGWANTTRKGNEKRIYKHLVNAPFWNTPANLITAAQIEEHLTRINANLKQTGAHQNTGETGKKLFDILKRMFRNVRKHHHGFMSPVGDFALSEIVTVAKKKNVQKAIVDLGFQRKLFAALQDELNGKRAPYAQFILTLMITGSRVSPVINAPLNAWDGKTLTLKRETLKEKTRDHDLQFVAPAILTKVLNAATKRAKRAGEAHLFSFGEESARRWFRGFVERYDNEVDELFAKGKTLHTHQSFHGFRSVMKTLLLKHGGGVAEFDIDFTQDRYAKDPYNRPNPRETIASTIKVWENVLSSK